MMKTLVNPSSTDSRKKNGVSTKSTDKQPNAFSEYIGYCTYSLYKKKRKHYIIFNNLRTVIGEHYKLTVA